VRNTLSDVLHLQRDDLGLTVTSALRRIADEDRGVLLVLSGEDTPEALLRRLNRQPSTQAPEEVQQQEWRQHGLGAQILAIWACIACVCSARRENWWGWLDLGWRCASAQAGIQCR
jgi:GTP cyclohydrolase II